MKINFDSSFSVFGQYFQFFIKIDFIRILIGINLGFKSLNLNEF
jgi:hypothetical protein